MSATAAPVPAPVPVRRALVRTGRDRRRAIVDRTFRGLSMVAAFVGIIPLFAIVAYVTINGIKALNLDLITKPPKALGVGGGASPPSWARSRWWASRRSSRCRSASWRAST